MEKRLIVAMALSLLVLLAWSALLPKPQYIDNKEVASINPPINTLPKENAPLFMLPETLSTNLVNYEQDAFEVVFIEPVAAIKEVKFKSYQDCRFSLQRGFLIDDQSLSFNQYHRGTNEISFIHTDASKKIVKTFKFSKPNYDTWLEITIQNLTSQPITFASPLVLGVLDFASRNTSARFQDIIIGNNNKPFHVTPRKNSEFNNVKFLALRDRYFCTIIELINDSNASYIKKIGAQNFEIGLQTKNQVILPGQQVQEIFHIYLGPQELQLINSINPNWSAVINYGTFDFISQILFQLLQFFYGLVHNWGWAIVILSIAIYLLIFPLTLKQMRSMKEMQAIQPQIEELRKLYKDSPQRLQKEQMELFRKHKVNPFGGCLPLLLQMPIFFALYQTLMRSVALKGASFLWIHDLSEPDKLFSLPFPKPFDSFNLLPILMMIGMFVQQKISTVATTSGSAAEQQKLMMIMMPLLFGFIFYSMPAGLVLYWFINSALMLLNQFYQSRSHAK
jgi:YidC/Oxa1 family membrane protein insertase